MKRKNLKKQDVPVIGKMLLRAFSRNKVDFVAFSNVFDGSFETDMANAVQAVRDRRRPADVFDKQKKVSIELYAKIDELQEALRLIGEYVLMAEENLKTLYEHYHIKKARKALRRKDVEGIMEHCDQIIDKVVNDDAVALDAVGFTAAKLAEFELILSELDDMNTLQNDMMDIRQDVKYDEEFLFDALYDFIDKVASVGKAMYTYKKKHKYDEFSVAHVLGRINHGRKKKPEEDESGGTETAIYDVIIGRVTDKITDDALENVVVRLEGTEIMVDTDEDGEFYLDEVPSGVYTVSFSKLGYGVAEQHNVEIGTSEMSDLRIELIADSSETKVS
jgi:Carboxypeptidase regulatory-like domain